MISADTPQTPPPPPASSFSLGSLFLMVTLAAIFITLLLPIARSKAVMPSGPFLWVGVGGIMLGGIAVGVMIGLLHQRRIRGALWGCFLGVFGSMAASLLWVAAVAEPTQTLKIVACGCLVLLSFAVFIRRLNHDDPSTSDVAMSELLKRYRVSRTDPVRRR